MRTLLASNESLITSFLAHREAVYKRAGVHPIILDQNGKPRAGLDSTGFQLLDDKGCSRILMAVDSDGPAVQVCDDSGKLQLNLGSSAADGSYGLSLMDQQGKVRARAVMRKELQGIASFGVYDGAGRIRANLSIGGDKAEIVAKHRGLKRVAIDDHTGRP